MSDHPKQPNLPDRLTARPEFLGIFGNPVIFMFCSCLVIAPFLLCSCSGHGHGNLYFLAPQGTGLTLLVLPDKFEEKNVRFLQYLEYYTHTGVFCYYTHANLLFAGVFCYYIHTDLLYTRVLYTHRSILLLYTH